jgi:hypothetical protein
MKNKWSKLTVLILGLLIIILVGPILLRDPIFMDARERRSPDALFGSYSATGAVKLDAETILDSLQQRKMDVFVLTGETSGVQKYKSPFIWKQADYLLITNSLHQFAWKEAVDDWNLHSMIFLGECSDQIGFDIARISYVKPIGLQEYSFHMIGVYPRAGEGEWGGGNFPRSLFDRWYYIDLQKLAITLEDAIQLAEVNGGEQARLSVNNRCTVDVSLNPYPDPHWDISYSLVPTRIFEMKIDAYTGKYEILNSR